MREVVIVSMARTPIGSFQGGLSSLSAPRLGAVAIEAALQRAGIQPEVISEVIMGNVLWAGVGQAPARQAMIHAGIPHSVPAMTINKVCGSGMKAVMLGAQAILVGDSEVVVAGGMESMSNAPYLLPGARAGYRMGHQQAVDAMVCDGLWDPYSGQHMGNCAELCAREKEFSREEQDEYAMRSFRRAQEAQKAGKFREEIAPVSIQGRKGDTAWVDADEGPGRVQFEKIPTLKPAFEKTGSVTAGNASTINDGAAALVLMSSDRARQLGVKPLGRIISWGTHSVAPEWFSIAPADAMRKAVSKAKWDMKSVDLYEVNEAFAVVALAAKRELGIPNERLNIHGGAIALGHPIGASGARILITLLSALRDKNLKRGLAGICIGGGEATAMCIERV